MIEGLNVYEVLRNLEMAESREKRLKLLRGIKTGLFATKVINLSKSAVIAFDLSHTAGLLIEMEVRDLISDVENDNYVVINDDEEPDRKPGYSYARQSKKLYNVLKTHDDPIEINPTEFKNFVKFIRSWRVGKGGAFLKIRENEVYIDDCICNWMWDGISEKFRFTRPITSAINIYDLKPIKLLFRHISIHDIRNAYFTVKCDPNEGIGVLGIHFDLRFARCHLFLAPKR
ncbi:MAG: hypothetical protein QXH34_08145 [Ignisphaera sp.]